MLLLNYLSIKIVTICFLNCSDCKISLIITHFYKEVSTSKIECNTFFNTFYFSHCAALSVFPYVWNEKCSLPGGGNVNLLDEGDLGLYLFFVVELRLVILGVSKDYESSFWLGALCTRPVPCDANSFSFLLLMVLMYWGKGDPETLLHCVVFVT